MSIDYGLLEAARKLCFVYYCISHCMMVQSNSRSVVELTVYPVVGVYGKGEILGLMPGGEFRV